MPTPRITFGMIVLNGEPFLRYNLRALYPFAHEIIVVEGACHGAASAATADGHSIDGTLDTLRDFQRHHDPENKVIVVTAEQDGRSTGFWPGEKHEQSQAYARRATGDWLWQVDVDEFYKPGDIDTVFGYLSSPDVATVSFQQIQFWGNIDTIVDGWYLRAGAAEFHRVFRWGRDFHYVTHRPPTVTDGIGEDLRNKCWIRGKTLADRGVYLYHYSSVFPSQVERKSAYYAAAGWSQLKEMNRWYLEAYQAVSRPYRVHNVYRYPSWLERFSGTHPPAVLEMTDEQRASSSRFSRGDSRRAEIDRLVSSRRYRLGVQALKAVGPSAMRAEQVAVKTFRSMPTTVQARVRVAIRPWVSLMLDRL
jgi:hypothetical protein